MRGGVPSRAPRRHFASVARAADLVSGAIKNVKRMTLARGPKAMFLHRLCCATFGVHYTYVPLEVAWQAGLGIQADDEQTLRSQRI